MFKKTQRAKKDGLQYVKVSDESSKFYPIDIPKRNIIGNGEPNIKTLNNSSKEYKNHIATYIVLSSFSYFEGYFNNVSEELIEFHFGQEYIEAFCKQKLYDTSLEKEKEQHEYLKKLRNYYDNGKTQNYEKNIKELENQNYKFPYEKFSLYGLHKFIEITQSNTNVKAVHIPELLEYVFGFEKINSMWNEKQTYKQKFDEIRAKRNNMTHNRESASITIEKAIDINHFLKILSKDIDKHLIKHFFIIQYSKK